MALPRTKPKTPPASSAEPRLWLYHKQGMKPLTVAGFATSLGTVEPALPPESEAEGLVLLTNDAEVARLMALPAIGWVRRYFLLAETKIKPETIAEWAAGPVANGAPYGPIEMLAADKVGAAQWYSVTLREGKGRSLTALCKGYGIKIKRLARVSLGPFQLGELAPGAIEELPPAQWQAHMGGKFKRTK